LSKGPVIRRILSGNLIYLHSSSKHICCSALHLYTLMLLFRFCLVTLHDMLTTTSSLMC